MKELTEKEALSKAEAYCSRVERCVAEVRAKLAQWGVDPEVSNRVVAHLQKEKYVDQQRYSAAFVRDKYRFSQWGRVKIAQALRMKGISQSMIDEALKEIDEEEYRKILSRLIAQKRKTVKAATDYERKAKLIRFAVGKGFEMDTVLTLVSGD